MSGRRQTADPLSVAVRVPASTSNCGAGFDTLGLALQLYSTVVVRRRRDRQIRPATRFAREGTAMAKAAAELFFERSGLAPFGFDFHVRGAVPVARGLGSSVVLRAGIVAALNVLGRAGFAREALARVVAALEGHPDNAAPAVLGGFCVGRSDPETGELAGVVRRPIGGELVFVAVVPEQRMPTTKARGVLPARLPYHDAVRSVNSASYVTAAFLTGEFDRLRHAVADFMHEPYRMPLIPGARAALVAGAEAGALTGWLSGSGSTVLSVTRRTQARRVARAMVLAFRSAGQAVRAHVLRADNRGLRVTAPR